MSRDSYINVQIRVCGQENVVLTGSSSRFYIEGIVTGNVAGMTEAQRYIVIEQSTFSGWFAVSPTGDPCVINQYLLYATVSPLVPLNDPQIELTGGFGNHKVRIDRAKATNTKTFFLRAVTRGLKTQDQ
jgi:hypothetical protein